MKKEIKDADHRGGILAKEFDAINFKIHQRDSTRLEVICTFINKCYKINISKTIKFVISKWSILGRCLFLSYFSDSVSIPLEFCNVC